MPHKRTPVGAEQVTGLARLLRGNALAALENVALWHERDISHSSVERVIVPDSFLALDHMLRRMTKIVSSLVVKERCERWKVVTGSGHVFCWTRPLVRRQRATRRGDASLGAL